MLLWNETYIVAGLVFLIGSLVDILDGALARLRGQAAPRGAFIDSTTDRISEGFVLGAAALVFAREGTTWAIAAVFVALVGSFLVSYTRAKAEVDGLDGKAGLMGRAERVVLLGAILLAPRWGALPYGIALLAALTAFTVVQRTYSVYRQLQQREAASDARHRLTDPRGEIHVRERPRNGVATNGNGRFLHDGKVRVAIVGVGNCASSLVQGVEYYHDAADDDVRPRPDARQPRRLPRPRRRVRGGVRHRRREGRQGPLRGDLLAARTTPSSSRDVPHLGVKVAPRHDPRRPRQVPVAGHREGARARPPTSSRSCKDTKADVLVSYLPVGSEEATKWYVEQALEAGVAFVNCIPVFIAREEYWQRRFEKAGLPIIGDDIKSQVGATILHRMLARLFDDRGVKIERTYQLNVGGNTDFMNMLERERLESKKISKTNAVTSQLDYDLGAGNVHIGPSDYVPWLTTASGPTSGSRAARSATCR